MSLEEKLLKEAIRLGDELIDKAKTDEFGLHWETIQMGISRDDFNWKKSSSLYNGTAGILLFFIQLYQQTKEDRFLKTIKKGSEWLYRHCQDTPTSYYSFYTGRTGEAYVLTEVGKLTGDQKHFDRALELVKEVDRFIETSSCDDLLNGTAGTLLGLLHLHYLTDENSLLPKIKLFTEHLIKKAHLTEHGIYWDKSEKNIRGLCGYSHGVSGIAAVFLELGHYFQNPAFYYVAEQAFAYENHHFDTQVGNWPDFRKGIFDSQGLDEHRVAYQRGDRGFFINPASMSAWCHGAPGIGFSRARAVEVLGDRYAVDLSRALSKTHEVTVTDRAFGSFTLCHGLGGNAMLFLEDSENGLPEALKVAESAIDLKEAGGIYQPGLSVAYGTEDLSLFMGNAGIGYFYLMCLEPNDTPNVLSLTVPESIDELGDVWFTKEYFLEQLVKNTFPETIEAFNDNSIEKLCDWLQGLTTSENLKSEFVDWIRKQRLLDESEDLKNSFELEVAKNKLSESIDSLAHLHISRMMEKEVNSEYLNRLVNIPNDHQLQLADYTHTVSLENATSTVLLYATTSEVLSFSLNPFTEIILSESKAKRTLKGLTDLVIADFDTNDPNEQDQIKSLVIDQVKEMVDQGILVIRPQSTSSFSKTS